jgi:DNA-binding protein HU-beta
MSSISKADLIRLVSERTDSSGADAKRAVEATFDTIAERMAAGDDVNVSGFGEFATSERSALQGRNPQTGETIEIAATTAPKFSASSQLKTAVKGG